MNESFDRSMHFNLEVVSLFVNFSVVNLNFVIYRNFKAI